MIRHIPCIPAVFVILIAFGIIAHPAIGAPVFMANGIKVGEVTQERAIVWTRVTRAPERNAAGHPFPDLGNLPDKGAGLSTQVLTGDHPLEAMEGAAPGASGLVRVLYWPAENRPARELTEWRRVDESADFTRQFVLAGLTPATRYEVLVQCRPDKDSVPSDSVRGSFVTAPRPDTTAPVRFVVVTCGDYPRRDDPQNGHIIYETMRALQPDFFVHTGDIEYYDKPQPYAPNLELARFKWNRFYALPFQRAFHNEVASYFIKDDHDTLKDDCYPGQQYGDLTWEKGLATFREQVPMGEKTYRTVRWGKDLQIWMVEGRDFRSPNPMPDGPDKTIWGEEQKAWFKRTVQDSDATFRILISPTPLVGPDRDKKNDNHSNAGFAHEGNELRRFIAAQKNMVVINGDRHWQYVSVDKETGVREYGTGPSSDKHAGGWSQDEFRREHRYLHLQGGFLEVIVASIEGTPVLRLRHHGVNGGTYHADVLPAK
ncbi:MAG: alkaline phosphatase D family protein [Candidatus Hydrogenedentota bacterium]